MLQGAARVRCPLFTEMYLQEILHGNANKIELYVRFSRDLLDVSESIDVWQDLLTIYSRTLLAFTELLLSQQLHIIVPINGTVSYTNAIK